MKTSSKSIAVIAGVSALLGGTAFAAVIKPLPPAAGEPPAAPEAPVPVITAAPPVIATDFNAAVNIALDEAARQVRLAEAQVHMIEDKFQGGHPGQWDFHFSPDRPGRPRSFVFRGPGMDAEAANNLEEDLNIMSRVLTKGVREKLGEGPAGLMTAMGMTLKTLDFGGGSASRNLYLDGYGAVFFLNVGFPLVAPEDKPMEEPRKEVVDLTWEDAKRDLYGPRNSPKRGGKPPKRVEYDEEKVTELKESLLERLKNASNIRGAIPTDFVSVVVTGSPASGGKMQMISSGDNIMVKGTTVEVRRDGSELNDQSFLTLRAKKSDIDAHAKGDIDYEAFKKKVEISVY